MDVTSDKDLFDFIDNLGKEEKTSTVIIDAVADSLLQPNSDNNICSANVNFQESQTDTLWKDIGIALDSWSQRVLDTESKHSKSINFQQTIEDSLL